MAKKFTQCEKCDSSGWLFAIELDDYFGDDPQHDNGKYTCDKCHGKKYYSYEEEFENMYDQ